MPYPTDESLPKNIRRYSQKLRKAWRMTFNFTYQKVLKETGSKKQAEQRAFKSANSVLKKHAEKFGTERYGYRSIFLIDVDKWLNNLVG